MKYESKFIAILQLADSFGAIGVNTNGSAVWNLENIHSANTGMLKISISMQRKG